MTSREALKILNEPMKKEHLDLDLQNEAYNKINELVDRDTPREVGRIVLTVHPGIMRSLCSACFTNVDMVAVQPTFCYKCGQRLEW